MMRILLLMILGCLFLLPKARAQEKDTVHYLEAIRENGDTLPHRDLDPIVVYPRKTFKSRSVERRYWRLAMKVKKVYPFAKKAAELMQTYDARYRVANDPKLRRKYLKEVEKELFDEYGPQLKKLSISEGRILIKLIDRETKHTSYELIKNLKGGVSAFFWQGVARLFGNDLKEEYDPIVEDRLIEEIIFYIEIGMI
ncbi:MAG: DUF4294 domain-containing protein [Mangrovibacterium sp.]